MRGLMMNSQLTIPALLRHTAALFADRTIASRQPDGSLFRYSYGACLERAQRLGAGLAGLGLQPGARVATLCWNHARHLEIYYGAPAAGLVLHPLNPRLPQADVAYIMEHAGDQVLIADQDLLEHAGGWQGPLIVVGDPGGLPAGSLSYERLLEAGPVPAPWPDADEGAAAAMGYTSGTTGRPKGVLYSHRAILLHSLGSALPDAFNLGENDTILAAVPMFHANAWGLPYTAALVGARQVFARNAFDAPNLLNLIAGERVTFAAGVPTIWLHVLQELDRAPGDYDLSALRSIVVGGGACPPELIRGFEERHGIAVITSWGMTEMTPVGTVGRTAPNLGEAAAAYSYRATPGRPLPLVELRLKQDGRDLPWDGISMGELEVRGPWVARAYHASDDDSAFTSDGWFRTGDIASIDRHGGLTIRDRAKDLIKSGGEWISSVALENALLGHPAVAEAAVIAIPHPTWQERPLAVIVLRATATATAADLRAHLAAEFPAWYLPDAFVFDERIPRTGTGKVQKQLLRERFRNQR